MSGTTRAWDMKRPFALLPVLATLVACASLERESWLISEEDEVALGEEFHRQLLKEMPEFTGDASVQAWLSDLGQSIVPYSHRPGLAYHFTVVDAPEVNAFAVPGGYVYVTTGLLMTARDGAEVAGVLAHEIGHIAARHGVRALETMMIAQGIGSLVGDETISEVVTTAIQIGTGLTFSQDQEREADSLGTQYAWRAGYNPWAIVRFFNLLHTLEPSEPEDPVSKVLSELGELFSTHPPTTERIENVSRQIREMGVGEDDPSLRWDTPRPLSEVQSLIAAATGRGGTR